MSLAEFLTIFAVITFAAGFCAAILLDDYLDQRKHIEAIAAARAHVEKIQQMRARYAPRKIDMNL